ncbi:hypothetical protein CIB93_05280 [Streptomyces sp. WZ.A104]|uniref:hypothetical protein n=1 Tax=Streptomyces sp. WZ.A104 TaxID=2023771 RepID=UPI000BBBDAB3|nr:hypothetical protein [Streptomyces sp. WZ.A104]PCG86956.1 hypothetical protein CIB93_05280 [Streptomyces sp. WZ.A104]
MNAGHGLLVLMGSGETSPTMVTLHRELVAHVGGDADAVILETPYGFQVNRDDISTRAREYFRRSVGLTTVVAPDTHTDGRSGDAPGDGDADRLRDLVRRADWVFSGPGSPSYALNRWRTLRLGEILRERVARGYGVTVMASAAACTVGFAALPVYEVYKAGHTPAWLTGLDLLGALGLPVAVIPHYDNAEGGTHDTRFCYLGEPRLHGLEHELPDESAVLGIDEHTAVILDLGTSSVRVWGRGVMTVRRRGSSTLVPGGTTLPLERLRRLVTGAEPAAVPLPHRLADDAADTAPDAAATGSGDAATLQEAVAAAELRFDSAQEARDAATMAGAVVELESVIAAWSADMEEDQGGEWARTVLHGMIRRLAQAAGRGLSEPEHTLGRILVPLLGLRTRLRSDGAYDLADEVREALAAGGVQLYDTAEGSAWRWEGKSGDQQTDSRSEA